MATKLMEYDQVCDNCHVFIAGGEVFESHEDVTQRTLNRIAEVHGRLIGWMVNACEPDPWTGEGCTTEVIGACDMCGHEPTDGYWWGHKAALVYGNKVKVEGLDHPARQLAAQWQSPGTVGRYLAQFASTGEVWIGDLWDDMERVVNWENLQDLPESGLPMQASQDMDRLRELIIEALKEGER